MASRLVKVSGKMKKLVVFGDKIRNVFESLNHSEKKLNEKLCFGIQIIKFIG